MQDKLIEEVQALRDEMPEKKLRKPSDFIKDEDLVNPTKLHILAGLSQKPPGSVFQGGVDKEIVRKRREKNKRARTTRAKARRTRK